MTATSVVDTIRGQSPDERAAFILEVFEQAFRTLATRDPDAFRGKFRKMAASAFAFYRGSACLYYADVARDQERGEHASGGAIGPGATVRPATVPRKPAGWSASLTRKLLAP